jgi:peptidoglycan hydrolase-like protein with peptidoglycan-binding domain
VKEIQQALKIQVDGFFGGQTEQAVKEFQTAQSLEADGIVGPRTRAKLIPAEKEVEKKDVAVDRQPMAAWWLARGAMGDAVKEIQRALGIQADGFFGPRTEQAVKEFQAAHSLDADGIVGPRTRAKIVVPAEKKDTTAAVPPASAPAEPSVPESPALTELLNMGFSDVNLNAQLLKKHNGDIEQVVAELIGA